MLNVIYSNMQHKQSFTQKVCKEYIWTDNMVMFFPKNFYLIESINKRVSGFIDSGVMSHLVGKYVDLRYWHVKASKNGPQKLKFEHLEGAFWLLLALLLVSVIVLAIEIFVDVIQSAKLRLMDSFAFL